MARVWLALAAIDGFLAVAMGAFAAHGIADPMAKELLRTGAQYAMVHALAAYAAILLTKWDGCRAAPAAPAFAIGGLLFSGSLYALALGAPTWVGAITPLGGLGFLIGWAVLAWAAVRK